MTGSDHVRYDLTEDGVAVITLNRPDQMNVLNQSMSRELISLLDRADGDPKVRVVVLTGAGRAFCAGADLTSGAAAFEPVAAGNSDALRDWGGVLVLRIFDMLKPTVAAINGAAVGIGATLTLPCDIRVASSGSRFGFVFTRRGIVLDGCASWFLPRVVGISSALRWCLSGEIVSAEIALDAGLVASLHEPSDVLVAAIGIAREMSANTSPVSVALCRKLLWQGLTECHPMGAHRLESALIGFASASNDAREGVESFLEKREANFSSRVPGDLPENWPFMPGPEF
ncbi:MAG: enoyl-CoA hydratase-related protein [Acidimicrobiales bacterium]